jgi:hypothetical protein
MLEVIASLLPAAVAKYPAIEQFATPEHETPSAPSYGLTLPTPLA